MACDGQDAMPLPLEYRRVRLATRRRPWPLLQVVPAVACAAGSVVLAVACRSTDWPAWVGRACDACGGLLGAIGVVAAQWPVGSRRESVAVPAVLSLLVHATLMVALLTSAVLAH